MKNYLNQIVVFFVLLLITLFFTSCDKRSDDKLNNNNQTNGQIIEDDSSNTSILNDNSAENLIESALSSYTSIEGFITEDQKIINSNIYYKLDINEVKDYSALKIILSNQFTQKSIDEIITYYCCVQDTQGIFVCSHSEDDVNGLFEDFMVKNTIDNKNNTGKIIVDLQIGESGQSDTKEIKVAKINDKWLIDENPFAINDKIETGNNLGTKDSIKIRIK
ncbi:MAG: hypothetical protein IPP08_07095 [Chlorobiota bacterium]|jgi:hypothetical protein|nr:hypothetical protein [Chlorobiota bacterium]QQS65553.1 MAG: hypothetical protein IPP08_07095 [Chlorobiota bacterium]